MKALAVGHITHDAYGDGVVAGGSAYYAGHVWRGLGAEASVLSVVGEDFACDAALEGLSVELSRGGRTTSFTNLYPPGGERQMYVDAQAAPVLPELLPSGWVGAHEVVFLAPVLGEVPLEPWVEACRGAWMGLGLQGWLKTAGEGSGRRLLRPRDWSPPVGVLRDVQLVCLSREDLFGRDALLSQLVAEARCVVVTEGGAGCVIHEGGQETRVGVYPAREVDPTGAGDSFASAMLLALARGASSVEAARWGAAAASVVVEAEGGAALGRVGEAAERVRAIG